jgi:acetyltransferase-like isoleucine patch superfamily enzyme
VPLVPLPLAKLDYVRSVARRSGKRAGLRLARDLGLEWVGRQVAQHVYPTVEWGVGVRIEGHLRFNGRGRVVVGDRTHFAAGSGRPNIITVLGNDAVVELGEHVMMNGTQILAASRVSIGRECILGPSSIVDTDFHRTGTERRGRGGGEPQPIDVGDNVWIGASATLLKGVTIGPGSVLGAGTVIRHDVPPRSIVIGDPQQVVAEI